MTQLFSVSACAADFMTFRDGKDDHIHGAIRVPGERNASSQRLKCVPSRHAAVGVLPSAALFFAQTTDFNRNSRLQSLGHIGVSIG
jgi:hypothetical protein